MRTALILLPPLLSLACAEAPMTNAEALEALQQSSDSARGEQATSEPIEISTDFTMGDAVEAAAEQIAAWWASQEDCTTVTTSGATVTVDFGDLTDACEFEGHHYGGLAEITVNSSSPGDLEVHHEWTGLTNGDVTVDGGADVTWSGADQTRRVVTTHTWTGNEDGVTVDVEGDHVQGPLDPAQGVWGGITMEGTRDWYTDGGEWHLDMVDLELRLQDPAPQAGSFVVTNPDGKVLDITFVRLDEHTIEATLTGTRRPLVFHIDQLGIPHEVDESS